MTLIALAVAWIGSIALVAAWGAPWWLPAASVAALGPVAARGWLPVSTFLIVGMALAAGVAALRFDAWDTRPPPRLVQFAGQEVELEGTIASLPDPGRTVSRYRVDVGTIRTVRGIEPIGGAVLVTLSQYADLQRGAKVVVSGELEEAPSLDGFDYRAFLLRQGIAGTMFYPRLEVVSEPGGSLSQAVDESRVALERALTRALPEPEASLAAGITIGRDGGIDPELYDAYRRTGLAHIIAVSGSNVAIITGIVFAALVPLVGRNRALIPAGIVVAGYVLLAGAEWPVLRAGIMAGIFLLGTWLGRQEASLAALGAAVIVMTAASPGAAREVGFQLSVAATAGLIVFGPWIRDAVAWASRRCGVDALIPPLAEQVLAISIAATVATLPLLWLNFDEVSIVGPLANVLVEPLFVLAFGLGLLTALAGVVWEPAGWAVGLLAYYPLAGCSWIATTLAGMPGASVALPGIHAGWAAAAYVVLSVAGWFAFRYPAPFIERAPVRREGQLMRRAAVAAGGGMLVALVAWQSLKPIGGPGHLELAMLDVGQGDALLVTTPGGRRVIIDGGPSGIEAAREVSSQLPHWERDIDAVVLSHPQQDHIGGLPELLRRYDVGRVYDSGRTHQTEAFNAYVNATSSRHVLVARDTFTVDGVEFQAVWPARGYRSTELNNTSLVLRVRYGATTMLLTGDIESAAQLALLADLEDVTAAVLKVPHHGSATSSAEFLAASDASVALISVGEDNQFGHPTDEALEALVGAAIYRTDLHGRVVVRSDGERIEVETERD